MHKFDAFLLTAQVFAILAIGQWSNGSRVPIMALVVVACLALVRAVIVKRTGAATGSPPSHWLLLACVSGVAWWIVRDGKLASSVALILVAMSIAMAAAQAFRERQSITRRLEKVR